MEQWRDRVNPPPPSTREYSATDLGSGKEIRPSSDLDFFCQNVLASICHPLGSHQPNPVSASVLVQYVRVLISLILCLNSPLHFSTFDICLESCTEHTRSLRYLFALTCGTVTGGQFHVGSVTHDPPLYSEAGSAQRESLKTG